MSLQNINIGFAANDGTGDDLRESFIKVNQNFQYLETFAGGASSGANLGSIGAAIYSDTADGVLKFRRLVAGTNVTLTEFDNTISVDVNVPDSRFAILGDTGSILAGNGISYGIVGTGGAFVNADENTKTITVDSLLSREAAPQLGANLTAENYDITNVGNLTTNTIVANVSNSSTSAITQLTITNLNGVNYQDRIGKYVNGFDMGEIAPQLNSLLDWIAFTTNVDFGTFNSPTQANVDLGLLPSVP